jgi:hypothetical protein
MGHITVIIRLKEGNVRSCVHFVCFVYLERAKKTGLKPEELMIEYLQTMIKKTESDPLEELVVVHSNVKII